MPAGVTPELVCDWDWMVNGVAAQRPAFRPGTRSAYYSHVYGWLIGEIVRRTDRLRRSFGEFVRQEICEPLGIDDLWLGVPDEALPRARSSVAASPASRHGSAEHRREASCGPFYSGAL
jgi:CubicO group peptidase (beta-lactamase class C family)